MGPAERREKDGVMAEYMLLIYIDENDPRNQNMEGVSEPYQRFMQAHGSALRGGSGLEASSTSTSVRPDGSGGFAVTDGAFAETKEALGGYFIVEAANLDEALAIAKDVPTESGVEVRPVRMRS
jgi:hypothetical protein